jgi:hypothetical protein
VVAADVEEKQLDSSHLYWCYLAGRRGSWWHGIYFSVEKELGPESVSLKASSSLQNSKGRT